MSKEIGSSSSPSDTEKSRSSKDEAEDSEGPPTLVDPESDSGKDIRSPKGEAEDSSAPDSEIEHLAGEKKSPPNEEQTQDYWVVESDRITRIHQTPRYWLYVHDPETFPVPIAYIDVLRFTKTNVKGHGNVVDCWMRDSDQIPGPWMGRTSFNLRVPNPKPGWVIQNGRPTKVEANSKRPEHIWSEEWKIMTRKQRQYALQKWKVLQTFKQHNYEYGASSSDGVSFKQSTVNFAVWTKDSDETVLHLALKRPLLRLHQVF